LTPKNNLGAVGQTIVAVSGGMVNQIVQSGFTFCLPEIVVRKA